jgi:uncharacterized membrane protein YccC
MAVKVFLLLLFPLLVTLQLFKLQQKQRAGMWGQFIVFMANSQSRVFSSRVTLPPGEGEEAYSTQAMAVKVSALFPLLVTLQLFKLQQKQRAGMWGQFIVFMGSFIEPGQQHPAYFGDIIVKEVLIIPGRRVSDGDERAPPTWDYQDFFNDNIAKVCGVLLAWLAFQVLRPSSDERAHKHDKLPPHSRPLLLL